MSWRSRVEPRAVDDAFAPDNYFFFVLAAAAAGVLLPMT